MALAFVGCRAWRSALLKRPRPRVRGESRSGDEVGGAQRGEETGMFGVELAANTQAQLGDRFLRRPRGLVGAANPDGLVGIGQTHQLGMAGNRGPMEPIGIAATVPALVMMANRGRHSDQAGRVTHNPFTYRGMQAHL